MEGQYVDESLPSGTKYFYRLRLSTASYNSPYTVIKSAVTLSIPDSTQTHIPQKNGNISAISWKGFQDERTSGYTFQYDELNRLKKAEFAHIDVGSGNWSNRTNIGGYSVSNLNYDLNGNIQSLNRQNGDDELMLMDELMYSYNGNQLMEVEDYAAEQGFKNGYQGQDYAYDANGNLIKDLNKEITLIEYNELNLPRHVEGPDGKYVDFYYDAAGVKHQKIARDEILVRTDYDGEFIFELIDSEKKLVLIQHDEGRIVQDIMTGGWDYQYHLKDHLGNVRTTFSTAPKTIEFNLNYESSPSLPDDEIYFEEITTVVSNDLFNHTSPDSLSSKSQLLTSGEGSRVGSILTLPVGKGDVISAQVFAKYESTTGSANTVLTPLSAILISALTGQATLVNEFGTQTISDAFTGTDGSIIGTAGFGPQDPNGVKAFLNVLFLSDQGATNIDSSRFAFDQISGGEQQIGNSTKTPHDSLSINNFVAPSNGIVIIYVSNESEIQRNVYFDDLKVTVNEHPIVQADDYYPFGLTFNSYKRVTGKENNFLYNQGTGEKTFKTERISALDLNVDMTKFRVYDPAVGRFWQVDPLADTYPQESWTPYQYAYDDPINNSDPYGDCPSCVWGGIIGAAVDYGLQVTINLAEGKDLGTSLTDVDAGSILVSAGAGAISGGISSISKARKISKLVNAVVEVGVDASASTAGQLATNGEVNVGDVIIDVAVAQTVGKVISNKVEANAKNSPEGRVLSNAADRKERIANNRQRLSDNGGRSRPAQRTNANSARGKADAHGKARAAAAGTAASGAGSEVIKRGMSTGGGGYEIEHKEINYPKGILGQPQQ